MSREHFIPFRAADVVSMCADELPAAERESFRAFARILTALLHHRFHARLQALKDAYHPFTPEADVRSIVAPDRAERRAARERLQRELSGLATAANFTPIDLSEFERAMSGHSLLKVRLAVDLDVVDTVMFFRRGESVRTRQVPSWFGLRRREVSFTNYARVLVYATFKEAEAFSDADRLPFSPGSVVIKLFQNVPRDDLEMVLPNVQVRMRRVDKLLIGVPALVSGIVVLATKLFSTFSLLFLLLAFWIGLSDKPVTLSQAALISAGAGIIAFGAFVARQVTKFKNRKILFMKALSENLYFRNLDNDAGVFHHLLDAAEEAELTEALLAYHFVRCARNPLSPAELDRRIEDWLAHRWEAVVDFDVEDGLRKLHELDLISADATGHLSAVELADARRRLDQIWDGIFTENDQPGRAGQERLEQARHG
jgi:hypothetical protein